MSKKLQDMLRISLVTTVTKYLEYVPIGYLTMNLIYIQPPRYCFKKAKI